MDPSAHAVVRSIDEKRQIDRQAAMKRDRAAHNRRARPFVWTKPATDILAAVSRSPEPSV